jgi:hypothetical protein
MDYVHDTIKKAFLLTTAATTLGAIPGIAIATNGYFAHGYGAR